MQPERYTFQGDGINFGMIRDCEGSFVQYADYKNLEEAHRKLEMSVGRIPAEIHLKNIEISSLKDRIIVLKKTIHLILGEETPDEY